MDLPHHKMRDLRVLKNRVEALEKENAALRKSLFELSSRFNLLSSRILAPPSDAMTFEPIEGDVLPSTSASSFDDADDMIYDSDPTHAKSKETAQFYPKMEIKGHQGAVYAVGFSPRGDLLASGSFDKTLRIWDVSHTQQKELHCFYGHTLNVSTLWWSPKGGEVLTGSYDQTSKIWDVETGKAKGSWNTDGFVQCVRFPEDDDQMFGSGTSRNLLAIFDRRHPEAVINLQNDAMINSFCFINEHRILSGDSVGQLKTWDLRAMKCIDSFVYENNRRAISHVAWGPLRSSDPEKPRNGITSQLIAINSYDSVLRVFDWEMDPIPSYRHIASLRGHKNKNWPIKSCFWSGRRQRPLGLGSNQLSHEEIYAATNRDLLAEPSSSLPFADTGNALDQMSILATGSADRFIYVYGQQADGKGDWELMQRVEGHTDRIYDVGFHPLEPIMCSASADFTVRLWVLRKKK